MEVEVITMRSAEARFVTPDVGPSYPRPGERLVEKLVNPGPDRLGEVYQQFVQVQQVHEEDLAAGVVPPQGDEARAKDLFTAIGDAGPLKS